MIGNDLNILGILDQISGIYEAQKDNLNDEQRAELDVKMKEANIPKLKSDLISEMEKLQQELNKIAGR
jgi:hypothetical protein